MIANGAESARGRNHPIARPGSDWYADPIALTAPFAGSSHEAAFDSQ